MVVSPASTGSTFGMDYQYPSYPGHPRGDLRTFVNTSSSVVATEADHAPLCDFDPAGRPSCWFKRMLPKVAHYEPRPKMIMMVQSMCIERDRESGFLSTMPFESGNCIMRECKKKFPSWTDMIPHLYECHLVGEPERAFNCDCDSTASDATVHCLDGLAACLPRKPSQVRKLIRFISPTASKARGQSKTREHKNTDSQSPPRTPAVRSDNLADAQTKPLVSPQELPASTPPEHEGDHGAHELAHTTPVRHEATIGASAKALGLPSTPPSPSWLRTSAGAASSPSRLSGLHASAGKPAWTRADPFESETGRQSPEIISPVSAVSPFSSLEAPRYQLTASAGQPAPTDSSLFPADQLPPYQEPSSEQLGQLELFKVLGSPPGVSLSTLVNSPAATSRSYCMPGQGSYKEATHSPDSSRTVLLETDADQLSPKFDSPDSLWSQNPGFRHVSADEDPRAAAGVLRNEFIVAPGGAQSFSTMLQAFKKRRPRGPSTVPPVKYKCPIPGCGYRSKGKPKYFWKYFSRHYRKRHEKQIQANTVPGWQQENPSWTLVGQQHLEALGVQV